MLLYQFEKVIIIPEWGKGYGNTNINEEKCKEVMNSYQNI